eukprot:scaffold231723_cov58-Attheya_sp.AAC.1
MIGQEIAARLKRTNERYRRVVGIRAGWNMKVIYDLARPWYSGWVSATSGWSSSGRVHFCHGGQLLLLPVGWYWSSIALYTIFCTGMLGYFLLHSAWSCKKYCVE